MVWYTEIPSYGLSPHLYNIYQLTPHTNALSSAGVLEPNYLNPNSYCHVLEQVNLCLHTSFLLYKNEHKDRIYLTRLLQKLNNQIHVKGLESLPHTMCSININIIFITYYVTKLGNPHKTGMFYAIHT